MDTLKTCLITAPVLKSIDYPEDTGTINLAVDSSLTGWGAILQQILEKKRHSVRNKIGLWGEREAKYDAGKRECCGLMKALEKVRFWLYGMRFITLG